MSAETYTVSGAVDPWYTLEPRFRVMYERCGCNGMARALGSSTSTPWDWYTGHSRPRGIALKLLGIVIDRWEIRSLPNGDDSAAP